ncbi:MAG: CDP-diacylglycerol--glycerol-3-phosphate 3-phosphatidyltransferase [Clostridia bacterium]|nr:CDP-diacylglycerol--glycerol-3-phosphate 3-phosphatidyltransferase [Clostridia bacterium]
MNIPNKLTLSRAIITPVFLAVMLIDKIPFNYTAALILFIVASVTDYLDGKIARSKNIVTNFGKILDPVADKMLTTAAFLGFTVIMPTENYTVQVAVMTFIILFREFIVASVRLIAVSGESKKVIPANMWGKLKTVSQMICIIVGLSAYSVKEILPACSQASDIAVISFLVLGWISVFFTAVSGIIYVYVSRDLIDNTK